MLDRVFRWVVDKRWWVIGFYALLLAPAIYFAIQVPQDNSIDRLIVESDPDAVNARAFEKVFGHGEYVVLLAEAPDPFAPDVLRAVDQLERKLVTLPHVSASSALDVFRARRPDFSGTPDDAAAFKQFALGTELFKRQALVGPTYLGIPVILDVHSSLERQEVVASIDRLLQPLEKSPAPLTALRKVGEPYVNAYLDHDTRAAGLRLFPIFFLFVVILNFVLYRSVRALIAFVITLAVSAALSVGYVGATGGTFTIISALVPMTILITCTATLVYLHSRFVECPPDRDLEEHRIFALKNKFLACTASIFATAVGFAALAVSEIKPIRQMGIWVAIGLAITWVLVFTLFPALQKILNAPTQKHEKQGTDWFAAFTDRLPMFTYRYRWVLVPGSLLLSAAGAIALFGMKPWIQPMELLTNPLEYINHGTNLYKDTKRFEEALGGLSISQVWLKSDKPASVTDGEVLKGLTEFADALEKKKEIGSVVGMPTMLRTVRYVSGQGDQLPTDEAGLDKLSTELETLLQKQPLIGRFVEQKRLDQVYFAVVTPALTWPRFEKVRAVVEETWKDTVAHNPAMKQFEVKIVGYGPLAAKISYHMVPTLVESFALTVVIIFGTFLLVFRNGAARLMAMIPSLFAILVMFGIMRLTGVFLNVATILIASTVLGTSENDQIHFFYHFLEKSKDSTEAGLKHTLSISGRAILYATLINAGGFLAFALGDLPPMRQFGSLACVAFVLSMIADFTALPAALWIVFRARPDALAQPPQKPAQSTQPTHPTKTKTKSQT